MYIFSAKCIVWAGWRSDETALSSYRAASVRCQLFNSRVKCKIYDECKRYKTCFWPLLYDFVFELQSFQFETLYELQHVRTDNPCHTFFILQGQKFGHLS